MRVRQCDRGRLPATVAALVREAPALEVIFTQRDECQEGIWHYKDLEEENFR